MRSSSTRSTRALRPDAQLQVSTMMSFDEDPPRRHQSSCEIIVHQSSWSSRKDGGHFDRPRHLERPCISCIHFPPVSLMNERLTLLRAQSSLRKGYREDLTMIYSPRLIVRLLCVTLERVYTERGKLFLRYLHASLVGTCTYFAQPI